MIYVAIVLGITMYVLIGCVLAFFLRRWAISDCWGHREAAFWFMTEDDLAIIICLWPVLLAFAFISGVLVLLFRPLYIGANTLGRIIKCAADNGKDGSAPMGELEKEDDE